MMDSAQHDGTVSAQHHYVRHKQPAQPKHLVQLLAKPNNKKLSTQPANQNLSMQPDNKRLFTQPANRKLSTQPDNKKLSTGAATKQKLFTQPADQKLSMQPDNKEPATKQMPAQPFNKQPKQLPSKPTQQLSAHPQSNPLYYEQRRPERPCDQVHQGAHGDQPHHGLQRAVPQMPPFL